MHESRNSGLLSGSKANHEGKSCHADFLPPRSHRWEQGVLIPSICSLKCNFSAEKAWGFCKSKYKLKIKVLVLPVENKDFPPFLFRRAFTLENL